MLTKRQQELFKQLDLEIAAEREIRDTHKQMVQEGRAVKDFTRYLTKWLHRRWSQERNKATAPYLGD
jgi:hypothetical protein